MELENLKLTKEDGIGYLTFTRSKALNALNTATFLDIDKALDAIEADDEIKVVIVSGEGRAFIAGADISEMKEMDPTKARVFAKVGPGVCRRLELMEKPFIAAVHGFVLGGGCELAMCCDFMISAENTKFGQPEVTLGIIPGCGGTQRLTRLVGRNRAKEICLTGDLFDEKEAYRIGLVNRVVPADALMEEAVKMAKKILSRPQVAINYAKHAINRGIETDLDTGLAIERELFGLCFATEDQKEGMTAFVEKRKPEFKDK